AATLIGSGPVYSAFTVAFNLPNLIRAVVADNAISAAFVPVFLGLREQGEEEEAWQVAGMVVWTTAVVLGAVSALLMLLAPLFVPSPSGSAAGDLAFAFRLFMLPQGLFSVAVSTVLFPELARAAAGRDMADVSRIVARGSRAIVFLLLPAAVISIALAEPVVRLLYQHGNFDAGDTTRVSAALVAFSLGL